VKVIVFTRDFPPEFGGVQRLLGKVADHYGKDALVIARRCPGFREYDQGRPYTTIRMRRFEWRHANPVMSRILGAISYLLRFFVGGIHLGDAIRRQKTDLVLCGYAFPNGLPMVVARLLTGCPFVVWCHGTETLRALESGGLQRAALRLVWRLAVRVVVHSRFMRDEVARFVPPEKIIVNRLGSDSGNLDFSAAPATAVDELPLAGRAVVLTVGRLERRKGHDLLAHAMPLIREKIPHVLWLIVGDGPERERLTQAIADWRLADCVRLLGRRSDAEVSALLARADLFAMPSRRIGPDVEAFGIVYLEAARFGVPAVGGRSGGVADAVQDGGTGLLCDPEDPRDIAAKVITLLGDPARRAEMGRAAKANAERQTWDEFARHLSEELSRIDLS